MISWHKVGQKVAVVVGGSWWSPLHGESFDLSEGDVYEISKIEPGHDGCIYFELRSVPYWQFDSRGFRPVYPQAIESLRQLDANIPSRVRESA